MYFIQSSKSIEQVDRNNSKILNIDCLINNNFNNLIEDYKLNDVLFKLFKSCESKLPLKTNNDNKNCSNLPYSSIDLLIEYLKLNDFKYLINICTTKLFNLNDRIELLNDYYHDTCLNIFKHSINNQSELLFNSDLLENEHYIDEIDALLIDFNEIRNIYYEEFKNLNNCTLNLINIYLNAQIATCQYQDFIQDLKHYDCNLNIFSINSNCTLCKVSGLSILKDLV